MQSIPYAKLVRDAALCTVVAVVTAAIFAKLCNLGFAISILL